MLPKLLRTIDETGHKENGELFWTWIFRAPDFAAFVIDKSRGSQVLIDVLGCDYFSTKLDAYSKKIIAVATIDIPDDKDCKNMANRFLKHGDAYFQFITTPGIDPTNNIAEQALHFVVMYRHVSQGTRSENGRNACECFWSVVATCVIQGRSAFTFIKDAFLAFFNGNEPPSLLPTSLSSP